MNKRLGDYYPVWIELILIFLIFLGVFTYIGYIDIKVALGIEKGLGYWMWLYIVFIFIVAGWMTLNTYRIIWKAESSIPPEQT